MKTKKIVICTCWGWRCRKKCPSYRQSPPPDTTPGVFHTLRWLLKAGVGFEFSNPWLSQISYRAVLDDVPLPEETEALIRSGSMQYFNQLVQKGMKEGDIAPDIDPGVAAFAFNAVFMNLGSYIMERLKIASQFFAGKWSGYPGLTQSPGPDR